MNDSPLTGNYPFTHVYVGGKDVFVGMSPIDEGEEHKFFRGTHPPINKWCISYDHYISDTGKVMPFHYKPE